MSLLIQIYEEFNSNKHYTLMKKVYLTSSTINTLSASGQRMLLHILCELKTGKTYEESQTITLEYLYFIKNKILSKNTFYKAINELMSRRLIYESKVKDDFYVNYYFINTMNNKQWREFLTDVRVHTQQQLSVSLFSAFEFETNQMSEEDCITYEQLYGSFEPTRRR